MRFTSVLQPLPSILPLNIPKTALNEFIITRSESAQNDNLFDFAAHVGCRLIDVESIRRRRRRRRRSRSTGRRWIRSF